MILTPRESLREVLLRAIQLAEVPSLSELISILEDVEAAVDERDALSESLRQEVDRLEADVNGANEAKTEAEDKLRELRDAATDTPEALARDIIELRLELANLRIENVKLREAAREAPKPKRRRSKKTPPDSAPRVIFPTYGIAKDASNVVRVAFGAKDPTRAQELFDEADKIDDVKLLEAEKLYREAIRLDPSMAIAHTNLGNVLHRRGDTDGAVSQYQTAMFIDPDQPEAVYNLGVVKHDRGEPVIAISLFELALSLCPPEDPLFPDIHYRLAVSRDEIGDIDGARTHWVLLIELDPNGEWAETARKWLTILPTTTKLSLKMIRGGREKSR